MNFHFGIYTLSLLFFSSILIIIFFIDLDFQIIPNSLTYSGIVIGLLFSFFTIGFLRALLGGLIGFGIFLLIVFLSEVFLKKEGMGGGDVKLAAMMGTFFGLQKLLLSLFFSFAIGAIIAIFLIITKIKGRKDYIPFGPSMVLASFISIFFGEKFLNWYFGLFII